MEALLVEILTDSVSGAKLFDLAESAANIAAVFDLDSLAESGTGSEVEALDRSNFGPVAAVQRV